MTTQLELFSSRPEPVVDFMVGLERFEPAVVNPYGLRYYQRDCVEAVEKLWREVRSCLALMATGTGKTKVFCALTGRFDGRVLVLAHRDHLVEQAVKAMEELTGEPVGIEQGPYYSGRERIVVGSVQTVYRDERLKRLDGFGGFDLVITDEAHHYLARTYRKAVQHWPKAKVLGVTATADRSDGLALGQIFDDVAYEFDIADATEAGYLAPIQAKNVPVDAVDLRKIKESRGDLKEEDLDRLMMEGVEGIAEAVLSEWPDRCGLVFFPRKRSAEYACERFNLKKAGCAAVLTDDTPPGDRKVLLDAVRHGDVQYLVNCMIATEGFDWPEASLAAIARPTKSRLLFAQMCGRVTRPEAVAIDGLDEAGEAAQRREAIAASGKPDCIVADFVANFGEHKLVTAEDILGGRYTEPEIREAKKRAKEEGGGDPAAHLKEAREYLEALAKSVDDAEVSYRVEDVDPFDLYHMKRGTREERAIAMKWGLHPVSKKQRAFLKHVCGFSESQIGTLTKGTASRLIGAEKARTNRGLASGKQLHELRRWGLGSVRTTDAQAKLALAYLRRCQARGQVVDPSTVKELLHAKKA